MPVCTYIWQANYENLLVKHQMSKIAGNCIMYDTEYAFALTNKLDKWMGYYLRHQDIDSDLSKSKALVSKRELINTTETSLLACLARSLKSW